MYVNDHGALARLYVEACDEADELLDADGPEGEEE